MKFEQIIELIDHVSDSELTSFQYENEDTKISMKCGRVEKATSEGMNYVNVIPTAMSTPMMSGMTPTAMGAPVMQTVTPAAVNTQGIQTANPAVQNTTEDTTVAEPQGNIVKSPLVGTFYAAPAEDAPAFVKVGDKVTKGQIIAIVEAMKLMNDIESDFDGEVTEIYVKNGDSVEYGQPLFCIG